MHNRSTRATPPGTCVQKIGEDTLELRLEPPIGHGSMKARAVSPHFIVAVVDFTCESCPSVPFDDAAFSGFWEPGTIFTVNHCMEGRCEVSLPGQGYAIVKPGDFCVSCFDTAPDEYRYPLGRYQGVEVIAHSGCANDPLFRILQEDELDLESSVRRAGFAALYAGNARLNGFMERLGDAHAAQSAARLAYESLGLLLALCELDLSEARPSMLLTRSQMTLARTVREQLEADISAQHDVRGFASKLGVSASTLNNYFSTAFGQTVAAYLRRRRMEEGAALLAAGSDVATASLSVGYENPSKFAAAFKRSRGMTPSEFRRQTQAERL